MVANAVSKTPQIGIEVKSIHLIGLIEIPSSLTWFSGFGGSPCDVGLENWEKS